MTTSPIRDEHASLVLHLGPPLENMSDREFFDFCQRNPDVRLERTQSGDLLIMPPTGGETGRLNFALIGVFSHWVDRDGTGIGFDSSTGFALPNGARRSPDLAWVPKERWQQLNPQQREQFPPLSPDFVVELRSRTDDLEMLKEKMGEYIECGTRLGWLIDPYGKSVYIYRPDAVVQYLEAPANLSGEPELAGLQLNLAAFWR
jgi:Uma2 family endonuclease